MESELESFTTIIPAKTLVEVAKIFADAEEPIKLVFNNSENLVLFATDDTVVATRILDGQYPDYKAIIPKESSITATFAAEDFQNAVRLANVFAKDENKAIKLHLDPEGTINVSSIEEETGKHEGNITAAVEGGPVSLTFNAKYLLEFLSNIKAENITLSSNGNVTPCSFAPDNKENFLHIIMPMQI